MNTRANPATRDRLGLVLVAVTVIVMVTVGYFAHLHRTRQKHCQGKLQKRRNRRSGDRMFKLRDVTVLAGNFRPLLYYFQMLSDGDKTPSSPWLT